MPGFLEPIWETIFRVATWSALIFGALSIGSAFVSAWVGWEITDATQKDADARIKAADVRIADANERTENLRKENLLLEEAVAPRILEQSAPAQALKRFAGMQVLISAVPDFESQRFAGYVFEVLKMAEWAPQWLPADPDIMDGILVEWQGGIFNDPDDPTKVDFQWNARGEEAALALSEEFKKQNIEARTFRFPPPRRGFPERRPGIPPEAITVKIGVKPAEYFLEKRFPQIKAMKEEMDRIRADAQRRAQERLSRLPPEPSK
jgi:hypothetical protein